MAGWDESIGYLLMEIWKEPYMGYPWQRDEMDFMSDEFADSFCKELF